MILPKSKKKFEKFEGRGGSWPELFLGGVEGRGGNANFLLIFQRFEGRGGHPRRELFFQRFEGRGSNPQKSKFLFPRGSRVEGVMPKIFFGEVCGLVEAASRAEPHFPRTSPGPKTGG